MASELWQCDATELGRLIRLGRASAREATLSCLARLRAVNPQLNAVEAADAAEGARAQGEVLGPLHGVPVTVKVNTDQKGHATTNGVVAFRDVIAREDAPVVANLRRAGAIIIGGTNTPAFSMRIFSENALHGRTCNPCDPAITPGGSRGGAGAAVASGIGPIGHGNDIGGSVRIPAYCCGVVGLRVGMGRVPSFNPSASAAAVIGSQLMSTQGPLTRSVRDARLALAVMARGDARDTRGTDVPISGPPVARPVRVALVPEAPGGFTHPTQAAALRQAGRHLAAAGYAVEEVTPPDFEAVVAVWHCIGSTDVLGALKPNVDKYADDDAKTSMRLGFGLMPPADLPTMLCALAQRDLLLRRWLEFMIGYPLIVMPTLADEPPPHGLDLTKEGQRRVLDSLRVSLIAPALDLPGLAVPVGTNDRLRPAVQIVAARFREDLCLEAGEVIEAAEDVIAPIDPVG